VPVHEPHPSPDRSTSHDPSDHGPMPCIVSRGPSCASP
jgi:hypothetical protein